MLLRARLAAGQSIVVQESYTQCQAGIRFRFTEILWAS